MNEEKINEEIKKADTDKLERIQISLDKLKNKKSKFLFCVPEAEAPSASIYELYFHATVVKKLGYDVYVLVEKGDYEAPKWIESELTDITHMAMDNPKLMVGPEDIMVIPEVYSNVMEQTKKLPCVRIGLLQSVDYMLNALIPGTDWSAFGINEIITTSDSLKTWVDTFYGGRFNVKTYNVGIPDYFKKSEVPQKPVISIVGRNPNEISKIVKLFYAKFPQYAWITFDPMLTKSKPPQPMRRVDFAKRLQGNFAAVWIDRISSFGTFPVECMKSGVIPVVLRPDIIPEYMLNRDEEGKLTNTVNGAGVWTDNFYDVPLLLGDLIIKYLDDTIPNELYDIMENVSTTYTQENSEKKLAEIYESYVSQRIGVMENALQEEVKEEVEQK